MTAVINTRSAAVPIICALAGILFALGTTYREALPPLSAEVCLLVGAAGCLALFGARKILPLVFLFGLVPACAGLSVLVNGLDAGSLRYAVLVGLGAGFALTITQLNEDSARKILLWILLASAGAVVISALAMVLFSHGVQFLPETVYGRDGYYRSNGFLDGPNYYGISLFSMLVAAVYLVESPRFRTVAVALGGVVLMGLVLSLSRAAILATVVLFATSLIGNRSRWREYLWIVLAGLGLAALVWLSLSDQSAASTLGARVLHTGDAAGTRWELALTALDLFSEGNWLFGAGRAEYPNGSPHNAIASVLADYGLIGLASAAVFVGLSIRAAVRMVAIKPLPLAIVLALCSAAPFNDFQFVREWWMAWGVAWLIILSSSPSGGWEMQRTAPDSGRGDGRRRERFGGKVELQ